MKQKTAQQHAAVRQRAQLYEAIDAPLFADDPAMQGIMASALGSSNPNWVPMLSGWLRVQGAFSQASTHTPREDKRAFHEPEAGQLTGDIYIANSIPSGLSIELPLSSFGQQGHMLVAGTTGTGKSTLLNMITLQLVKRGTPTIVYDTLAQAAPVLVPHCSTDELRVLDFSDYRRNILLGPSGMNQLEWLRAVADHLMESLEIEPVTFNVLLQVCASIIAGGKIATVPRVIEALGKGRSQSYKALLNRLLPMTLVNEDVFGCDRGFDVEDLLSRSLVLNLKNTSTMVRRLVANDHYAFMTHSRKQLPKWSLKNVFVFHEAGGVASRASVAKSSVGEPLFLKQLREARNYGIGFILADQLPHAQHDTVQSNIGTKVIFRLAGDAAVDTFRTVLHLNEAQRRVILNLPDRYVVVSRPGVPFPFLARVPDVV